MNNSQRWQLFENKGSILLEATRTLTSFFHIYRLGQVSAQKKKEKKPSHTCVIYRHREGKKLTTVSRHKEGKCHLIDRRNFYLIIKIKFSTHPAVK